MNSEAKFYIEETYKCLLKLNTGCRWFDILRPKYKNIIGFDNDKKGNGFGPYLELKFYSRYAKVNFGFPAFEGIKDSIFYYCEYDSVDDLAKHLGYFVKKYFKSYTK